MALKFVQIPALTVSMRLLLLGLPSFVPQVANASDPTLSIAPIERPAERIVAVDPVVVERAGRALAMRITAPERGKDLPIFVFSHGSGLGRTDYRPFIESVARAGYIVIQPDHPDASHEGIPAKGLPSDIWRHRYEDLEWIGINIATVLQQVPTVRRRADASRLAVAGHSFGGYSAALAMGAHVQGMPNVRPLPYKASVLLAAPGHWNGLTPQWKERAQYLAVDWSTMGGPVLMVNGTADNGGMSEQGPEWHDDAFKRASAGKSTCLARVEGVGHYLGGIDSVLRSPSGDATTERRRNVSSLMVSFLDNAFNRETPLAKGWRLRAQSLQCK